MKVPAARSFMPCPHCDGPTRVRTSYLVSAIFRESIVMCQNPACGHTFVVESHIDRTLSPSAIPRPEVNLRVSTRLEAQQESERLKALEQQVPDSVQEVSP